MEDLKLMLGYLGVSFFAVNIVLLAPYFFGWWASESEPDFTKIQFIAMAIGFFSFCIHFGFLT